VTTELKLLDSSTWIEIFGTGPLMKSCQREMKQAKSLIVPTLVLHEVYRKIAQRGSEELALSVVAAMTQHTVVELNQEVALTAADLSLQHNLGMADSLILAHAQKQNALLITLDNDFAKIPGVKVLRS
jgi:predicted nucleic acid-binding protein